MPRRSSPMARVGSGRATWRGCGKTARGSSRRRGPFPREKKAWRGPGRPQRGRITPPPTGRLNGPEVAGTVIVRQRPGTAKGFFFITLEDETGFANAILTPQVFAAHRSLLTTAPSLIIGGKLQNQDGVVSLKADTFAPLQHVRAAGS